MIFDKEVDLSETSEYSKKKRVLKDFVDIYGKELNNIRPEVLNNVFSLKELLSDDFRYTFYPSIVKYLNRYSTTYINLIDKGSASLSKEEVFSLLESLFSDDWLKMEEKVFNRSIDDYSYSNLCRLVKTHMKKERRLYYI